MGTPTTLDTRYAKVEIKRGICDAADMCKRKECPFYDISREGTNLFIRFAGEGHTLEGQRNKQANEGLDREIYETMLQLNGILPPEIS